MEKISRLSKRIASMIRQLKSKKKRLETNTFLVEGRKNVEALIASTYEVEFVVGSPNFWKMDEGLCAVKGAKQYEVDAETLAALGSLKTNDSVLAVAKSKPLDIIPKQAKGTLILVADGVRDPGNLGSLIRVADWYGLPYVICSNDTVDWYNPKVLQASMGAFTRVQGCYVNLGEYLRTVKVPIIGASLDGETIDKFIFPESCILVVGNEAKGISSATNQLLEKKIFIPRLGGADSLNVSVASGIFVEHWRVNNKSILNK